MSTRHTEDMPRPNDGGLLALSLTAFKQLFAQVAIGVPDALVRRALHHTLLPASALKAQKLTNPNLCVCRHKATPPSK